MSFFYFAPPPPSSILPPVEEIPTFERPIEWLPLELADGETGFKALIAVYPGQYNPINVEWFVKNVPGNQVEIDFGDGSAPVVISVTTQANGWQFYNYDYDNLPATTLCTAGYRQAILTIKAPLGLVGVRIQQAIASGVSYQYARPNGWLDIVVRDPELNLFRVGHASTNLAGAGLVERVRVLGPNKITNGDSMFQLCLSLREVRIDHCTLITNGTRMFAECRALTDFYLGEFGALNTAQFMFYLCSAMRRAPEVNFGNAVNCYGVFNGCYSLEELGPLNFSAAATLTSAFEGCTSLRKITFSHPFTAATSVSNMFRLCNALKYLPVLDMPNLVNASEMISQCWALEEWGGLNAPQVTNISGMANYSLVLKKIGIFVVAPLKALARAFQACYMLSRIPELTFHATDSINTYQFVESAPALRRLKLDGLRYGGSYPMHKYLNAEALNELFISLGVADNSVSAQVLNITGCPGSATCDRTIATSKGFTVTG